MSCKISWSEENLSFLWSIRSSWWCFIVITSLLRCSAEVNHRIQNPSISGTCIEECSHKLGWITDIHIRHIGIILQIILNNMCFHLFSCLVNWAVSNVIDTSLSLGLRTWLSWGCLAAAIQLNGSTINWSWFTMLFNSSQVKLQMTFGLCKIDWLSISSDVPGFFC